MQNCVGLGWLVRYYSRIERFRQDTVRATHTVFTNNHCLLQFNCNILKARFAQMKKKKPKQQ